MLLFRPRDQFTVDGQAINWRVVRRAEHLGCETIMSVRQDLEIGEFPAYGLFLNDELSLKVVAMSNSLARKQRKVK